MQENTVIETKTDYPNPCAGDVLEVSEWDCHPITTEQFLTEVMLRVVAVHEERVWAKQYGNRGHFLQSIADWKKRLAQAEKVTIIRAGNPDHPF